MSMELPKDAKIARDAKHLMQELVSEFICFITSEANDISLAEKRKAISQEDILESFSVLGKQRPWAAHMELHSCVSSSPWLLTFAQHARASQTSTHLRP